MKTMKTLPKGLLRLLMLIVALMTVLTLVGCAGGGTKIDTSHKEGDDAATYFARILSASPAAREWFTAASRGYDIKADGFDPKADAPDKGTVDLEAAKAALQSITLGSDEHKPKFDEYLNALDAETVKATVEKMKTEIALDADNGPIDTLLVWIGKFVAILTKVGFGKYVFGLFFFAIIVEILMLPFGIKQQKNSIKQAGLRPKEMAIRKKYAGRNDQQTQQKMSQEIQKMYQEEGFNPMGGCLPLLIQFPIIIALYNIVIDPLRYVLGMSGGISTALSTYVTTAKAAGGLGLSLGTGKGTIELMANLREIPGAFEGLANFSYFNNGAACADILKSITLPDFSLFGLNLGNIPDITSPSWLLLVPALTFVVYFFSMKLTRKFTFQPQANDPQMGCSNKMMDLMMPLMSVYISFIVPAAVGVYWIFKSIVGTAKQFILHKAMPLPVFTEEDYKAAEKALKGKGGNKPEKRPAGERTTKSGMVVRSLHHIDDEDEPLPPPGQFDFEKARREAAEKKAAAEKAAAEAAAAAAASPETDEAEKPEAESAVPHLKEDRKTKEKDENK